MARAPDLTVEVDMVQVFERLDVDTRDALAMAPVGTFGLEALGLRDQDHADLEALGPAAREEAAARVREVREWMARERLADLAGDMANLDGEARTRLVEGLLAVLAKGGDDGR